MNGTVLVIEDNEQNLYLVTYLLEKNGFRVLQARDGEQGVKIAIETPVDLILLDIQLPKKIGYEVARELRAIKTLGNIPIVAVTSFAMAGDKEKALSVGCNGYIEKPIDSDTFIDEIFRHLPSRG